MSRLTGQEITDATTFEDVRDRLFRLRCKSKLGETFAPGEIDFCEECWKRWPQEYEAMGREVFRATAPFGSQV